MLEQSLVLIKPDAVKRNIIGKILDEYERNGLKIVEMKLISVPEEIAKEHYAEHVGKPFFSDLISYITSSPVVALVIEGDNAVSRVRAINGATNPQEAADNTIRALYGVSLSENTVHASDSKESAAREIKIWFG